MKGARESYDLAYRFGRGDADILVLYALYTVRARRFAAARAAIARDTMHSWSTEWLARYHANNLVTQ